MRVMEWILRVVMVALLALCVSAPAFAAFQGPGADEAAGAKSSTQAAPQAAAPGGGGFHGPGGAGAYGGFQGPGTEVPAVTVEQAKNMHADAIVSLTGNVVSHITGTKDKYMFRDATGEMVIEIDHKRFRGQTVTPANTVRICGEVDKDFGRAAEVDVKMLEVLK